MKTILLSITITLSAMCQAQQKDTTQLDSVRCIETRLVVHGGALAFAIFYTVAKQGFVPLREAIFRRESTAIKTSQYE